MAHEDAYLLYLARVEAALGKLEVGAYGKHGGKLVKKLGAEEFETLWQDFVDLRATYENMLSRGYTVDNAILKELQQRAADLIVELPVTQ
jgi:hypothetical protein